MADIDQMVENFIGSNLKQEQENVNEHNLTPELVNQIKSEPDMDRKVELARQGGVHEDLIYKVTRGEYGNPPQTQQEPEVPMDQAPEELDSMVDNFISSSIPEHAKASDEDVEAFINSTPEEVSAWREFQYGFESMPSDVENAGIWLESRFPIGRVMGWDSDGDWFWYESPEETYGDDFMDLSPEQRRQRIIEVRNKHIAKEYNDVILEEGKEGSGWSTVGKIGGVLATPTTAIPLTKGMKGAMAISAGIGAEDAALYGLAQKGKVDPATVTTAAVIGALAPPALVGAGKGLSKTVRGTAAGINRMTPSGKRQYARVQSLNKLGQFEDELAVEIARGSKPQTAWRNAKDNLGLDDNDLKNIVGAAGRKVEVPTRKKAYDIAKTINDGGVRNKMSVPNPVDKLLGVLQSRIEKISPRLAMELNRHEYNLHVNTHNALKRTHKFSKYARKLKGEEYKIVSRSLANGDFDTVERVLKHRFGDDAVDSFRETRQVLKEYDEAMKKAGYESGSIENYFPRLVKDRKKLLKTLGREEKNALDEALAKAAQKAADDDRTLTNLEESEIINKFLRGYTTKEFKPGFTKSRQFTEVTDEMLESYADPVHSLHTYIRRMTNDLERRAFFGRLGVDMKKAHQKALKGEPTGKELSLLADRSRIIRNSIGELLRKEREAGLVNNDDLLELDSMLTARFQYGDRSPSGWIQDAKNYLYASVLGNPVSAATQLGDVGLALYINGFRSSMKALFGAKKIDMIDLGLDDIAQELTSDVRRSSRFLDAMLRWGQFKRVDRFGKNTLLNGALDRFQRMSRKVEGRKKLSKKWRKVFGDDWDKVLDDLQTGRINENVKFMLWNELTRAQPISLSQVPEIYLRHPDGRILYMLKTFTLRQLDIIRTNIAREYRNGNKKEAFKNAAALTTFFGAANMGADTIKDWMMGKEIDVSDSFVYNLWGMVGVTEYLAGKATEGKFSEGVKDTVAPPMRVFDDTAKTVMSALDSDKEQDWKAVKNLPVAGKLFYNWFLGGLEKEQERQEREKRTEDRELMKKYGL